MSTASQQKTFVHLHTFDLRLHDSPSLHLSHQPNHPSTHFLPIYIFDPRQLDLAQLPNAPSSPSSRGKSTAKEQVETSASGEDGEGLEGNPNQQLPIKTRASPKSRVGGFHRTSPYRLRFLLEAVYELRSAYRKNGGDMLIGYGKPEILVPLLIKSVEGTIEGVHAQREYTVEEVGMLRRLSDTLEESNVELGLNDSKTLLPLDHLPFKASKDTPDVYTSFRKNVEGLGLGLGGGMLVEPLQTATWSNELKDGKLEGGVKVSVGKQGTGLKPFPTINLDQVSLPQGEGGWITSQDKHDTMDGLYSVLVQPLLDNPPIGGWSSAVPSTNTTTLPPLHPSTAVPFLGAEAAGLSRLEDYVGHPIGDNWTGGAKSKRYKETRNGLLGEAFSTKFSAWFSLGSLSPKEVGWRVGGLLESVGRDKEAYKNVYWILFELLWRDFFQFTTYKYSLTSTTKSKNPTSFTPNSTLFNPAGYSSQISTYPSDQRPKPAEWHSPNFDDPEDPARKWCEGRTGVPFIDANMRELKETGWMSNRGRQNVASFLVKDLYVDWRIGAEFFEMHLVDYDTCSNWGNWQYQAGVGNDPRSSRQFNPIKQAGSYDPTNEYVKTWIPELKDVSKEYVQVPWVMNDKSKLGGYEARPIVESPNWKKFYPGQGGGRNQGRGGGSHGSSGGGGSGGRGGARRGYGERNTGGGGGGRGERGGRGRGGRGGGHGNRGSKGGNWNDE
ncbi:hypothetical protein CI109_103454 [Kwoniella shandongensis]|uniref:Uncharacterized protein n=1 Tax=Kwoniella shandongensis TaxID=1734106 RepID=A0A5M6BW66_9TREE|nr:uncharacterized protein CI109_004643 [Kwoniella shandongensis]KAA5527107.1 hypothetical protein CI109_004643 [Kwoniella shandongensis]